MPKSAKMPEITMTGDSDYESDPEKVPSTHVSPQASPIKKSTDKATPKVPTLVNTSKNGSTKVVLAKILKDGSFEDVCELPHLYKKTLAECAKNHKYKSLYSIAYTAYYQIAAWMYSEGVFTSEITDMIIPDDSSSGKKKRNAIIIRVISIIWQLYQKYSSSPDNEMFYSHYMNIKGHGWLVLLTQKPFNEDVESKVEELAANKIVNAKKSDIKEKVDMQKLVFTIKDDRAHFNIDDTFKLMTKSMSITSREITINRIKDETNDKVVINDAGKITTYAMKDGKIVKKK